MSSKKMVVFGGSGFLGSRICQSASNRAWNVTSVSRSGVPIWKSVTYDPNTPPWSTNVQWEKGDLLQPSTYTHLLKDADCVIHSSGILLEADYKGVLQGRQNPISGLRRAFSGSKHGCSRNPLEKGDENLESGESDGQFTYELMNRDTAINLARAASSLSVPTFVFISAAAGAPLLPSRYIKSKRDAESTIASSFPKLRSIFIRPGFLYDYSRGWTLAIANAGLAGNKINGLLGGLLTPLAGAAVEKPLEADLVAEAVVKAVEDEGVKGVVATEQIEALGGTAWRRRRVEY